MSATATETPCRFALRCLGEEAVQPSSKEAFLEEASCAVCGGDAHGYGRVWRRERALTSSFGPSESLANQAPPAVCCVHFSLGRTFQATVATRKLDAKIWLQVSWRSYSHLFSDIHGHSLPRRADWRNFLTMPPPSRFLAVMSTAGMKNLIYRSTVSEDVSLYPLQVEDQTVCVSAVTMVAVLIDFEAALRDGLSRDDLLTGQFFPGSIFKVGKARWSDHKEIIREHQTVRLRYLRLAHAVANGPLQ